MRVYANNKMIAKKGVFGRRLSMAGLVILGLGMLASFAPGMIQKANENGSVWAQNPFIIWTMNGGWLYLSLGALIFGFVLGQIGNQYMRRFLRPTRPDMVIARSLKGFDDRNRLYVWSSPIDLAFAGPAGLFAIVTRDVGGKIDLRDGKIHTPFSFKKILSFFGDEGSGRPLDEAKADAEKLSEWLSEQIGGGAEVPVKPLVVFTNEKADLTVENADVPVLQYKQLKSFLRGQLKSKPINKSTLQQVIDAMDTYADDSGAESNVSVEG